MKFLSKNLSKIKGKTVLLRLDFNEPLDKNGKLMDDFRIQAVVPTVKRLLSNDCKVVIVSHLGRPVSKKDSSLSLVPAAERLASLLNYKFVETDSLVPDYPVKHLVFHHGDITKKPTRDAIAKSHTRNLIVLENIRYYKGEEDNSAAFAKQLASVADVYVNDAFAVSHRKDSSIVAITKYLPSYVGLLLEKEIISLDKLVGGKIKKPFVLVMGGIKISEKAKTLSHLGKKADSILVGGGIANLLFAAQGLEVGSSALEKTSLPVAKQILTNFKQKLVLPRDVVVSSGARQSKVAKKLSYQVESGDSIFDIGPETILEFSKIIKKAGTICWNGPMGYFEEKPFQHGTAAIAQAIGIVGDRKAFAVAGGGETVAAIRNAKQFENFDHVSTGGGAMLEYLAGKKLPGIEALK